jgi:hypothetical protein
MTKAEKEAYNKTFELFGGCCAICGSPYIEMHHIRYGACGRKTYLGNVIPLCKAHHMEVHSNKKKWQPLLIEMIDEKIRSDVK